MLTALVLLAVLTVITILLAGLDPDMVTAYLVLLLSGFFIILFLVMYQYLNAVMGG